ncbi:MAG: UDP-N-acetylglucosamine--N-acetylmuramyl-(pentapeptide) pyrophosphoryl-undecaprenol N-acetylglucosamine transferase [Planctomycetota bacterium]
MTGRPWFVFAGGGTAGHLFPALGVVESLRSRGVAIDISFFCTGRPIDREVLEGASVEAIRQSVGPISLRPWRLPVFLLNWRKSLSACRRAFVERTPAVVVGAGGYASGPPVRAAIEQGVPTFLLNPDAYPGLANRYLVRQGRLAGVFAQWPVTLNYFPADAPVMVTGCPVRRSFLSICDLDRSAIAREFGLDPDRRTLLVTGASQGARTINEAMMELADELPSSGWQVLHLSGRADRERVADAYSRAGITGAVLAFTDQMAEAMVLADLIISRAGASSLAEILVMGKPAILLPYPFGDGHQWHNGRVLVEAGTAEMLEDFKEAKANASRLGPVLWSLMGDDRRREEMGKAAGDLARPGAADQVADRLWQTAKIGA